MVQALALAPSCTLASGSIMERAVVMQGLSRSNRLSPIRGVACRSAGMPIWGERLHPRCRPCHARRGKHKVDRKCASTKDALPHLKSRELDRSKIASPFAVGTGKTATAGHSRCTGRHSRQSGRHNGLVCNSLRESTTTISSDSENLSWRERFRLRTRSESRSEQDRTVKMLGERYASVAIAVSHALLWPQIALAHEALEQQASGGPDPVYVCLSVACVIFAGTMSGLTLGLMSLSSMDLEILSRSGTELEREQVKKVKPLLKNEHRLLVTLLLCNAFSMEALPLCLDQFLDPVTAILVSVSAVLLFGEVIPQAVCAKYGLQVGAASAPVMKVLMVVCAPVAYPISKVLDRVLGASHMVPLRRVELKALFELEQEQGMLSSDERLIIDGAMSLTSKTVTSVTTPLENVFSLAENTVLDMDTMMRIVVAGYQRVPVHSASDRSVLTGLLVVKNMIVLSPADEIPLSVLPLLKLASVAEALPLHLALDHFQETGVHTAAVVDEAGSTIGIMTLSSVIEELLQETIGDQTNSSFMDYDKSMAEMRRATQEYLHARGERNNSSNGKILKNGSGDNNGNTVTIMDEKSVDAYIDRSMIGLSCPIEFLEKITEVEPLTN